jgi:hypothetical protein
MVLASDVVYGDNIGVSAYPDSGIIANAKDDNNEDEGCVDGVSMPRTSDVIEPDGEDPIALRSDNPTTDPSTLGAASSMSSSPMGAVDSLLGGGSTIGLLRMPVALSVGNGDTCAGNSSSNNATISNVSGSSYIGAIVNASASSNAESKNRDILPGINSSRTPAPIEVLEVPNCFVLYALVYLHMCAYTCKIMSSTHSRLTVYSLNTMLLC